MKKANFFSRRSRELTWVEFLMLIALIVSLSAFLTPTVLNFVPAAKCEACLGILPGGDASLEAYLAHDPANDSESISKIGLDLEDHENGPMIVDKKTFRSAQKKAKLASAKQ